MAGIGKAERMRKAAEALELVSMQQYAGRLPHLLSGGQRQRAALARAIVSKPQLLLLDEPLGALDLRLRQQMQHTLISLQKELGIAFVYVTHDQGEALSMSNRVLVMREGRIAQLGTPQASTSSLARSSSLNLSAIPTCCRWNSRPTLAVMLHR